MVKRIVLAVVIIMLLLTNKTKAGVSVVVNGSFENDGLINPITEENTPQKWRRDVNLPSNQFGGWVYNDWSTYIEDGHSLTLYSDIFTAFTNGDMATLSQWVYLADVNEIIFDIKLATDWLNIKWDPNKRSAVLLIDDVEVWNSDNLESNETDEYNDVAVDVNGYDENLHKLSLGIKADIDETAYIQYWAQWDFVRFDTHGDCNGFDYPPGDIDRDCYVDMYDLQMLADQWLESPPAYRHDPSGDDEANFLDFAIIADNWMGEDFGQDYKLLTMDLNIDGIVNFLDFAILAEDWEEGDYIDIAEMTSQWLMKSWLYGLE